MTPAYSLALACVALALLTSSVAVRMLVVRVGEMRRKRIHPQQIATSAQATEKLQSIQVSDNYRNLFEMPAMFYALCALLLAMRSATAFFAAGAWLYVLLRCAHSVIHYTYNRVMHRFAVSRDQLRCASGVVGAFRSSGPAARVCLNRALCCRHRVGSPQLHLFEDACGVGAADSARRAAPARRD